MSRVGSSADYWRRAGFGVLGRHGWVNRIQDTAQSGGDMNDREEPYSTEWWPEITDADIEAIVRFLPVFEQEGFDFGEVVSLSTCQFAPEVDEFIIALDEHNWVMVEFPWTDWMEEDGAKYRGSTDAVAEADLDDLRRILTAIARQERYRTGVILSCLKSGLISAILRRLKELRGRQV